MMGHLARLAELALAPPLQDGDVGSNPTLGTKQGGLCVIENLLVLHTMRSGFESPVFHQTSRQGVTALSTPHEFSR